MLNTFFKVIDSSMVLGSFPMHAEVLDVVNRNVMVE